MSVIRVLVMAVFTLSSVACSSQNETHEGAYDTNQTQFVQELSHPLFSVLNHTSYSSSAHTDAHSEAKNSEFKESSVRILKSRRKRSLIDDLIPMIKCGTNCNPKNLLGYGNYCGAGGSGQPIDDIDRCCKSHDQCYDYHLKVVGCWGITVYLQPYTWKCSFGSPFCGFETSECKRGICNCDRRFVECLKRVGCP